LERLKKSKTLSTTTLETETQTKSLCNVKLRKRVKGKRQISPITGPRCPEGSRKLRFPDYMTTAQDGGSLSAFTPRK